MGERFVLLGHPVSHSVSPAIHHAAYAALGLDHEYGLVDCADEAEVRRQVDSLRAGQLAGCNVTVPYKHVALQAADRVDASAEQTGVANVLAVEHGEVVAYNTDAIALAEELSEVRGAAVGCVLGNGGAALAAVVALRQLEVSDIFVSARKWRHPTEPRDWPRAAAFERLGAQLCAWPEAHADDRFVRQLAAAHAIVQATSSGMKGADAGESVRDVVPWQDLAKEALAYDVVYNPPRTPFLEAAEAAGVRFKGGLGMLVGQAARSIEIWLKVAPPVSAMQAAAQTALFGSRPEVSA